MEAFVDAKYAHFLNREKDALSSLKELLQKTETDEQTIAQLDDIIAHLETLFLVVIVGEFNAGKSSVLNAFFGAKLMEEGPIPTTAKVTIIRHGEEYMERQLSEFLVEKRLPSPYLLNLNLVDTPGTNSIVTQHQELTERFIPRADLVLFITSFDRPLSESERQFLHYIRDSWGKKLVFVLNKLDLSRNEEMLNKVLTHVRSGCMELMNFEPKIFPVSADQAFRAKEMEAGEEKDALWKASNFEAFETFITEHLTDKSRLALKLNAPIDAGSRLLSALDQRMEQRVKVLVQDEINLKELDQILKDARKTLIHGYGRHITEVDNLLLQLQQRGSQFLDDTIRISKLSLIKDRDKFKEEFARQVVRDTDKQVESQVTDAVDGLLKQALSLWNQTLTGFAQRVQSVAGIAGSSSRGDFFYNRSEVFNNIMKEADRKIETYDLKEEARRILENSRNAAALFMGAEAVAAGIGAVATVVVTATAVDVTGGFIAAGIVALVGLIFLPRQKRKAMSEFNERTTALREDMKKALVQQLDAEVDKSLTRVSDTVSPYINFVNTERLFVDEVASKRKSIGEEIDSLRSQIEKEVGTADIEKIEN
ncbi:MAG: dynamin family protein [Rhodothermales bacterium]